MDDITLRVRPGFTHGVGRKYQAGDTFTVAPDEAALLLRSFGDKLEHVPIADTAPAEDVPAEVAPGASKRKGAAA